MLKYKMKFIPHRLSLGGFTAALCLCLLMAFVPLGVAGAVQNPQNGSTGIEGVISSPPPTRGGTITTPSNGQVFTTSPITVNGLCPTGLLVKIFDNNIFVGSVICTSGSYSIQIDLFNGQNQLVARVYDALDQAGPDSNQITVTFNDQQSIDFGTRVSISSDYAKRGANPGEVLTWPIILSGGSGPYAISVDWGDNSGQSLQSESFPGNINIGHTYKTAGVYRVTVTATDHNGTTAYLQLVGVATGQVSQSKAAPSTTGTTVTKTKTLWWPAAISIPLLFASFWLGRRFELASLRHKFDQNQS
jgi:hypothetical protein